MYKLKGLNIKSDFTVYYLNSILNIYNFEYIYRVSLYVKE